MQSSLYKENSIYELVPLKMPHYSLVEGKIVFMAYKPKNLPDNLIDVFKLINDEDSIGTLITKNKNITPESFLQLEKERCIVLAGKRAEKRNVKPRVLILAPHADDAMFSLGGCIWKYGEHVDFYIVNVFGRQDYTMYWKLFENSREPDFVHKEEKLAWRLLGIDKGQIWEFEDAPLRAPYQSQHVILHGETTDAVLQKEAMLLQDITAALQKSIDNIKPGIILCPLGIGSHVDHMLLREACLKALKEYKNLYFYEDLPYAITFDTNKTITEVQSRLRVSLEKKKINIKGYSAHKKYLLNIYQSQIMPYQAKAIVDYGLVQDNVYEYIWGVNTGGSF